MNRFPIHTTYGSDLLPPMILKMQRAKDNIANYIRKNLINGNGRIPEDSQIGRLILITKTESPVEKIEETRPIVVQKISIRIIEKLLKTKLESCKRWRNFEVAKYQWGFQRKNSMLVNIIRAKSFLLKFKRIKLKSILYALDLKGAFDNIQRKVIIEAIKAKINQTTTCQLCKQLWAITTQLLRKNIIFFDNSIVISSTKGTPQGGTLSPVFFVMALDYILNEVDSAAQTLIEENKIIASADDILITIKPTEWYKIEQTVRQLERYGLEIHRKKWFYLAAEQDQTLNKYGNHTQSLRYLGTHLSYSKPIIVKKIKNSCTKNIQKIRKFWANLPEQISKELKQAWLKSIILYHLSPSLITNEINFGDAKRIVKSAELKIKSLPACWNYELLSSIIPWENTVSWIRRWWQKQITRLRENPKLRSEMSQWLWKETNITKYTHWMIWRQGYSIREERINKLLDSQNFRLMIQINKTYSMILTEKRLYLYVNATKYGIRLIAYREPPWK